MNKKELIEKLEAIIETVKNENNYIVSVDEREMVDVEKVTDYSEAGKQVIGLKEVGKNIDIDITFEYVESKNVKLEDK